MYAYVPLNFRPGSAAPGTGWTDGVGHLGARGGVLLCGHVLVSAFLAVARRALGRVGGLTVYGQPAPLSSARWLRCLRRATDA
jgi:hypothetical protein